jgi:hypothetical protein
MRSLIDGLLKKMNIRGDKELQAAKAQLATLEITDYSEYHFIWSSGWVRRLYRIRTAGSAGTKQTDAYTIELRSIGDEEAEADSRCFKSEQLRYNLVYKNMIFN